MKKKLERLIAHVRGELWNGFLTRLMVLGLIAFASATSAASGRQSVVSANQLHFQQKTSSHSSAHLQPTTTASAVPSFDQHYRLYDKLLKKVVVIIDNGSASRVNYKRLKQNLSQLDQVLAQLSAVTSAQFNIWQREQQMAFLINAYNAFTLKLITKHYPLKSIKKIGGWFSSPWKIKFIPLFGHMTYLDHIENDLLRKKYNDPRVHFAVNCASIGCPMLRPAAYTPRLLGAQLDEQGRLFMRDNDRNRILKDQKELHISKIFDWFEDDFKNKSGSVAAFVAPYMTDDEALQQQIRAGKFDISYTDYNWNLNDTNR